MTLLHNTRSHSSDRVSCAYAHSLTHTQTVTTFRWQYLLLTHLINSLTVDTLYRVTITPFTAVNSTSFAQPTVSTYNTLPFNCIRFNSTQTSPHVQHCTVAQLTERPWHWSARDDAHIEMLKSASLGRVKLLHHQVYFRWSPLLQRGINHRVCMGDSSVEREVTCRLLDAADDSSLSMDSRMNDWREAAIRTLRHWPWSALTEWPLLISK